MSVLPRQKRERSVSDDGLFVLAAAAAAHLGITGDSSAGLQVTSTVCSICAGHCDSPDYRTTSVDVCDGGAAGASHNWRQTDFA